jgi:branched-chain amino acid transport system ATP-binding protein
MTLLEARDVVSGYGDVEILHGVDIDVERQEIVTIIGPNGAGKSTMMKAIYGLVDCWSGTVSFDGTDITDLRADQVTERGMCYVPQRENVFPTLTVRENLEMGAYIEDDLPEERLEAVFERFPILRDRQSQRGGSLSGGQQQMLAMGRALMLDPDLLLLDEPSAGLAPDLVEETLDRIDDINDSGTAVLIVEQNAKEALRRCDRGYVLVQGQNRHEDTGEALLNDQQVREDFLGG